jgi:hypothetical protein
LTVAGAGRDRTRLGQLISSASNLTFQNLTFENRAITWDGATCSFWDSIVFVCGSGVTLENVEVDGLRKGKAAGDSNRLGGIGAAGDKLTLRNVEVHRIRDNKGFQGGGDDLLVEDSDFHDVVLTAAGASADVHLECAAVTGGDRQVWRRNRFYDCGQINWVAQNTVDGPAFGPVTLENNLFVHPVLNDSFAWQDGAPCLTIVGGNSERNAVNDWVVRYNTFECAISIGTPSTADDDGSAQWYGNLGADPGCAAPEWNIHHNVGEVCAGTRGNVVVAGALNTIDAPTQSPFYVDAARPAYDFRLRAGAAALGAGDPTAFPAVDRDGRERSKPPDAGAYERAGD